MLYSFSNPLLFIAIFFYSIGANCSNTQVVILGSPTIDHYFFLTKKQLKSSIDDYENDWLPIDRNMLAKVLKTSEVNPTVCLGGSGVNIARGLSYLGLKTHLIGKIGDDEKSEYYANKLLQCGLTTNLNREPLPMGHALCFITPDGNRITRTYLGASHAITHMNLSKNLFCSDIKYIHIEGYQLADQQLVLDLLKIAKDKKIKVSLDLASAEIVQRNADFIRDILKNYIDIVFCSDDQSRIITNLPPCDACDKLSELCDIVVIGTYFDGIWIKGKKDKFFQTLSPLKVIDPYGASDLFACGFLYGQINNFSLHQSAGIGKLLVQYIVKRIGCDMPKTVWDEINERIKKEF